MRVYKCLIWLTSILTLSSLLIAIIINCRYDAEYDFEENISLAIFGSAAVTVLSSVVTYHYEKRKTLESFLYNTVELVKFLGKYQEGFSLEKKIQFYLDYYDIDKHMWDVDYENISFFFDIKAKNKKYIYNNIYMPLIDFDNAVSKYVWNFRWHMDGSGKNDGVMKKYIDKLETFLIKKVEEDIPVKYDENDMPISYAKIKSISPKLSKDIYEELYGRYLTILNGKKAEKQFLEDESNGKNENEDKKFG